MLYDDSAEAICNRVLMGSAVALLFCGVMVAWGIYDAFFSKHARDERDGKTSHRRMR